MGLGVINIGLVMAKKVDLCHYGVLTGNYTIYISLLLHSVT